MQPPEVININTGTIGLVSAIGRCRHHYEIMHVQHTGPPLGLLHLKLMHGVMTQVTASNEIHHVHITGEEAQPYSMCVALKEIVKVRVRQRCFISTKMCSVRCYEWCCVVAEISHGGASLDPHQCRGNERAGEQILGRKSWRRFVLIAQDGFCQPHPLLMLLMHQVQGWLPYENTVLSKFLV